MGLEELRRLEQWLTYLRWLGAACAAGALVAGTSVGGPNREMLAWGLVAMLAIGSLIIWGFNGRSESEAEQRRLGAVAFAFDVAVILSLAWIFITQGPYPAASIAFVVPVLGAVRYRMWGAAVGAVEVAAFWAALSIRFAESPGGFNWAGLILAIGVATLVAAIVGGATESLHSRHQTTLARTVELEEFDRMKDRFIAVTSHEMRGPLTAIIAGVDTVRRKGHRLTPEQNEKLLAMVSQQGGQLGRLVDDLLVTSQLQTGTLALHPRWAELEATIREALEAAAGKRRGHQLDVFVEPISCEIDPARLGQIVRNLVENGYKYTPDKTVVTVTAGRSEDGVAITVADNGDGIPEGKRGQLFDAFKRIEETAAGREGVGLGLYVVSQLTSAMGGRIDLASSSRGTTFTIHIPCEVQSADRPHLGVIEGEASDGSS